MNFLICKGIKKRKEKETWKKKGKGDMKYSNLTFFPIGNIAKSPKPYPSRSVSVAVSVEIFCFLKNKNRNDTFLKGSKRHSNLTIFP